MCEVIQPNISAPAPKFGNQGQAQEVGGQRNAGQERQQGVGVNHRWATLTVIPATG